MRTLLLSFHLQWNKLASQALLTKGHQRNWQKTQQQTNQPKQFITVFIFNLEQKKGENSQLTSSVRGNKSSSIRENSGECLQHKVSKFCSAPSHSSEYCRKERFSSCFHPVRIGNEKTLNLPALCSLWSISHAILVILNEQQQQKNPTFKQLPYDQDRTKTLNRREEEGIKAT